MLRVPVAAQLRAELARARRALAEVGDEDELRRQIEEAHAAEKEQRVEHLGRMAARRLGKKELSAGWQAWLELYLEVTHQRRMLAASAARLSRPKLVACYRDWQHDWTQTMENARREAARLAREKRLNADAAKLEQVETELRSVKEELGRARLALAEAGDESGVRRAMEEAAAAEREKRIEHLTQMAAKRLGKKELSMGFGGWAEMALDSARRKRLLAAAGSRLVRPLLLATYKQWHADWVAEQMAEEARAQRKALAAAHKSRESAEGEMALLRLESDRELKNALRERDELLEKITQLDGGVAAAELELQRQLEEEREKRVAHLAKLGIERMRNAKLALGWSAWQAMWEEKARKVRALKGAASRLTRPKMVAAYSEWKRDWELCGVLERSKALLEAKASGKLAKEREAAEAAAVAMQKEVQLLREALLEGAGGAMAYQQQVEAQQAAEREARIEHLTQMAARRMGKKELSMGWQAWCDLYEEQTRRKRMLLQASARLTRPMLTACYSHWRRDWVSERASQARMSIKERLNAECAKRAETQAELARCKTEVAALAARLSELDGGSAAREIALQRQLEEEKDRRVESLKVMAVRRIALKELSKVCIVHAWMLGCPDALGSSCATIGMRRAWHAGS